MTSPNNVPDSEILALISKHEVYQYHPGALLEFSRSLLALASQPAQAETVVPAQVVLDGKTWRVVPVEPTTGMLVAGNHCQPGEYSAKLVWQEMLAASERSGEISYLRPLLQDVLAPVAVDEREAFESEMRCEEVWGHRSLKRRMNGKYENWQVDLMWDVWQARSALSARSGLDGGDAGGEARLLLELLNEPDRTLQQRPDRHQRVREAYDKLSTTPQAAVSASQAVGDDTKRLDALGKPGWELSENSDPECMPEELWQVHKVSGGRNDREWTLIGQGATPRAAIDAALAANKEQQG